MDESKIGLLVEAERRGILPPDKADLLTEARKRGLVEPAEPAPTVGLTKTAEPYDPSFGHVLSKEFFGGASDVATGVSNALSTPGPDKASQNALGVAQTGLGILRMLSAPITAGGSQLGESTGELTRQVAEAAGLGPTGQAIAGTAVGAPVNVAFQLIGAPAVISAAIPRAMQAVQGGAKMLPGAQVALRKIGQIAMERLPSILKPVKSSEDLFNELKQIGNTASIALPELQKTAQKILTTEQKLGVFGESSAALEAAAAKTATAAGSSVPFETIQALRQRYGARIGELRLAGGSELGSVKQLYKSLSQDLENAANQGIGPVFAKLKAANKAANREFAIGELDDIFNATMGRAREGAEFTSSNFAQALNKVRDLRRDDELFRKGLGDVNLDSIERRLEELRKLKVLPPPKGVNAGSMLSNRQMGIGGGIGTAIGAAVGGPMGATIGGGAGVAAGAAVPMLISRLMQSPKGSQALTNLLKSTGEVSPQNFAALIALAKTEGLDDETGFRSIMKSVETDIKTKIGAANERYNLQREKLAAEAILNRQ